MINTEEDWKTSDINVDPLWVVDKRDNSEMISYINQNMMGSYNIHFLLVIAV